MATKAKKENVFDKAAKHMGKKTDKKPVKKDIKKVAKKEAKKVKKSEKATKKESKKLTDRIPAAKRVCVIQKCRKLDKHAKGRVRLNTMVTVDTLRNMQRMMAEQKCSIPTLLDQAFGKSSK